MNFQDQRPYYFLQNDHDFYIKTMGKTFPEQAIRINRFTSKIDRLPIKQFDQETWNISTQRSQLIYLIVGVISIMQEPYLCLVTKASAVGTFLGDQIYWLRDIEFFPFKHQFLYGSIDQTECEKILDGIKTEIVNDNFYFTYHEDITLTHQKQFLNPKRLTQRKYFWNEDLLLMFARHKLPLVWRIPIMQGFVKEIHSRNNYFTVYYLNISRRSKFRAGTRFNARGIDYNFNSANFVQTQQIFICHNYVFSHVSLRGSVPIFWEQSGFGADIRFSNAKEQENEAIIQKHYKLLQQEYCDCNIVTINLLSNSKSPQKDLKNRMEHYYFKVVKGNYLYFDLNEQTNKEKNDPQKVIQAFLAENKLLLAGGGNFFCAERNSREIRCRQKKIARVNCLDCIDRTNVVLARISELYLDQVEFFINAHATSAEHKLKLNSNFKDHLIELWAELGNRLSMIYCGTQSVANHLTKKQTNSFLSFFSNSAKSMNRYYNANVNDSSKQLSLEYFLGKREDSTSNQYFEDNVVSEILKNAEDQYCTYAELGVYALTWNCNMVDPESLTPNDLQSLLNFKRSETQLVIICLQEMVELNSYNVILANNDPIMQTWRKILTNSINYTWIRQTGAIHPNTRTPMLDKELNYEYLTSYSLVGISTFIFVQSIIAARVSGVQCQEIKTGFKGSLGNKGAIITYMNIDSTPITIVNCHLAAGETKSSERIQDIDYIHQGAIKERKQRRLFDKSEIRFFIGDINFRLQVSGQEVRKTLYSIQKRNQSQRLSREELLSLLSPLQKKDEFELNHMKGALLMYKEPPIFFLPSYKYVKKSKDYDIKRTPSWCDRILVYMKDKFKVTFLKYSDVNLYLSDHKPVVGVYRILCRKQNPDAKKRLIQQYYQN